MRPRLLFISPFYPSPQSVGSLRRAHAVAVALSQSFDVSILVTPSRWHTPGLTRPTPPGVGELASLSPDAGDGKLLRLRRHLSERHPRTFSRLFGAPLDCSDHTGERLRLAADLFAGRSFDVIHAFRMASAPYALAVHKAQGSRPALHLDVDDIESISRSRIRELHHAAGEQRASLHESVNVRAYGRWERSFFPRFDRLYVCSETDAARLRPSHRDVRILPNTVPVPRELAPEAPPGITRILFIGSLGYAPNIDGLRWFCSEVLPALRNLRACELVVAGFGSSTKFEAFLREQPGVVFLGRVPESSEVYSNVHFTITPLHAGGGTRIKILEAFSLGRAVVTTTIGIEGINASPGKDHLRADTTEDFLKACLRLIDEPVLRSTLARNAFDLVSSTYSQDKLAGYLG
jgi:polysaccharide biosynthesis protein PslH